MNTKQCTCCLEVKAEDAFSFARRPWRQSACKKCRSKQQIAARKRKAGRNPTEWLLPHMGIRDQLECVRFRKWAGPVFNRGPLVGRLSA